MSINLASKIKIIDTEFTKVRLGNKFDGGYVCLDEINKITKTVFSFGIADDISFEADFKKKYPNSELYLFDPYVSTIGETAVDLNFKSVGLSAVDQPGFKSLETFLNDYSIFDKQHNSMLKIDIEFNEWEVLEEISLEVLNGFSQILIELHFVPVIYNGKHSPYFTEFFKNSYNKINNQLAIKYAGILTKLQKDFFVHHLHINNSLNLEKIGESTFPFLLELSLINKRFPKNYQNSKSHFPIDGLDYPNKIDRPDILDFNWNSL